MNAIEEIDWLGEPAQAPTFQLRGRQQEWLDVIDADLPKYLKVLVVAPGGIGKSSLMGQLAPH